jgi:hypothetical protein
MILEVTPKLDNLELDILERIQEGKIKGRKDPRYPMADPIVGYIVWVNEGRIEMGPVRYGYRKNIHTNEGTFDSWSASPFPGAWTMVPMSKIIRVRHAEAM